MYTDIVMEHFRNPQNVGTIENPDGIGGVGDPDCGDYLKIYLRVVNGVIEDIKFKVHGCGAAIASSSMTTVLAKGKPVMDAYTISAKDIVKSLGGLPEEKIHCSVLGATALKKAIVDYAQNITKNE
ncbi:Fe-S cluster assembly scaffold protein NifU [Clostridium sediminicola]|uniref:iron-sulfur cluster assembly scaffold protein n=1 Tax=Clostridium sediminicola TaxID=3114879 RepID=UPI0031F22AF6